MNKQNFLPGYGISFFSIIKVVCLIAFSAWTLGCGGGGGGSSSSSSATIPATTNSMKIYQGGETLTYDYLYTASYYDGSGAVMSSGKETQSLYSGWSSADISNPLYKLVINDQPTTGVSTTLEDFYFYDTSKNLIRYLTGTNHYSNKGNPTTGSLFMPSVLSVGYGWSNTTYLKQFNGIDYYGTVNYTIVSKEVVSVPMGNVEAYKITYTGNMTSGLFMRNDTLRYNGEYFVNPSIGIVKTTETGVEHQWYDYNYSYSSLLNSINWTP